MKRITIDKINQIDLYAETQATLKGANQIRKEMNKEIDRTLYGEVSIGGILKELMNGLGKIINFIIKLFQSIIDKLLGGKVMTSSKDSESASSSVERFSNTTSGINVDENLSVFGSDVFKDAKDLVKKIKEGLKSSLTKDEKEKLADINKNPKEIEQEVNQLLRNYLYKNASIFSDIGDMKKEEQKTSGPSFELSSFSHFMTNELDRILEVEFGNNYGFIKDEIKSIFQSNDKDIPKLVNEILNKIYSDNNNDYGLKELLERKRFHILKPTKDFNPLPGKRGKNIAVEFDALFKGISKNLKSWKTIFEKIEEVRENTDNKINLDQGHFKHQRLQQSTGFGVSGSVYNMLENHFKLKGKLGRKNKSDSDFLKNFKSKDMKFQKNFPRSKNFDSSDVFGSKFDEMLDEQSNVTLRSDDYGTYENYMDNVEMKGITKIFEKDEERTTFIEKNLISIDSFDPLIHQVYYSLQENDNGSDKYSDLIDSLKSCQNNIEKMKEQDFFDNFSTIANNDNTKKILKYLQETMNYTLTFQQFLLSINTITSQQLKTLLIHEYIKRELRRIIMLRIIMNGLLNVEFDLDS